ncbi:MAG: pyridoxal-phosphate dependent enzyme, partial [Candidatus Saccharimonadales bacterium]
SQYPLGSIKSIQAYSMLQAAKKREELDRVHTLVEASSGNAAMSIAIIARQVFGILRTVAVVSKKSMAPGKLRLMELAGVEIENADETGLSAITLAHKLGKQSGWRNLNQYGNEDNPMGAYQWLAPHLRMQTDESLSVVVVPLGTCGTAMGLGKFFREECADGAVKVIGVRLAQGHEVPGMRDERRLAEITLPWRQYVDEVVDVTAQESYCMSRKMFRTGLDAGPSSGAALAGWQQIKHRSFEFQRSQGKTRIVIVCPDSATPYLEQYENFSR